MYFLLQIQFVTGKKRKKKKEKRRKKNHILSGNCGHSDTSLSTGMLVLSHKLDRTTSSLRNWSIVLSMGGKRDMKEAAKILQ